MTPLLNRDIRARQLALIRRATSVDIASYNVHIPRLQEFLLCPRTRLLVGAPEVSGERQATITSTIRSVASGFPKVAVRVLLGSHIKLMICNLGAGKQIAIVGSQNLGLGHPFELAVELQGKDSGQLSSIFNRLWRVAQPVKSLDMKAVSSALASGVFESSSSSFSTSTQRNSCK